MKLGKSIKWEDGSPVTEDDILSLAGKISATRRKSKGGGPKAKLSEDDRKELARLRLKGWTWAELSQLFNVSTRTLRRYIGK